jgi:hypothetical protein
MLEVRGSVDRGAFAYRPAAPGTASRHNREQSAYADHNGSDLSFQPCRQDGSGSTGGEFGKACHHQTCGLRSTANRSPRGLGSQRWGGFSWAAGPAASAAADSG